jgi:serine O-acetyltransferase
MRPETLWWLSCRLHRRRLTLLARVLKGLNFLLFHTVLPYECDIPRDVTLWHHGLGTVIHPNTRIGHRVKIGHNVTITAGSQAPGSELAVVLGDDVVVGTGALVKPRRGRRLLVGDGAQIGAHAVVVDDVPAGALMLPPVAQERVRTPAEALVESD